MQTPTSSIQAAAPQNVDPDSEALIVRTPTKRTPQLTKLARFRCLCVWGGRCHCPPSQVLRARSSYQDKLACRHEAELRHPQRGLCMLCCKPGSFITVSSIIICTCLLFSFHDNYRSVRVPVPLLLAITSIIRAAST